MRTPRSHAWWKLTPSRKKHELSRMRELVSARAHRESSSEFMFTPASIFALSMGLYASYVKLMIDNEDLPGFVINSKYFVILERGSCLLCDYHSGQIEPDGLRVRDYRND